MLLIHLLLSSVSVECTSCDSFLRLFRNYVYYHFIFPEINKRGGVGISVAGILPTNMSFPLASLSR